MVLNITTIWLSSASLKDTSLLGLSGQICGEAFHFPFLENGEGIAVSKMTFPPESVTPEREGVYTILPSFHSFVPYWLLRIRTLHPELTWSESRDPFAF